ncbi:DoxX family protein [Nonomuraea sp. NPDC005983]|uniref:DoxX family protein n=1 Tax=Nonomuraea sp. NPDC005983 TaxID=3155595 RepID=UPI0033A0582A
MKRVLFDGAALISRLLLGVIFLAHGLQKWQAGFGIMGRLFTQAGIPLPQLSAAYATVVETVGGAFLIIGLLVRLSALLLLIEMIGAYLFVHAGHGIFIETGGWELAGASAAALVPLLALGGGRVGVDGILNRMYRRRAERRAAEADLAAHAPTVPAPTGTGEPHAGEARPGESGTGEPRRGESGAGESAHQTRPTSIPRQGTAPSSGKLTDDDIPEIDSLISDEPGKGRPPNR